MWTSFRAQVMPSKVARLNLSGLDMKPKAKSPPADSRIIEILDHEEEDTKEQQVSVEEKIPKDVKDAKPAAKDPRDIIIDNLISELQDAFKNLKKTRDKRKIACVPERESKKRKVSDAGEESPRPKTCERAVVSPPSQEYTSKDDKPSAADKNAAPQNLKKPPTLDAIPASRANSKLHFLLKTAAVEEFRSPHATLGLFGLEKASKDAEDLNDDDDKSVCDLGGASLTSEVDGTPQDSNLGDLKSCAGEDFCTPKDASTKDSYESIEYAQEEVEADEIDEILRNHEEIYQYPEEDDLLYSLDTVRANICTAMQWMMSVLPPSFGSCFLFAFGIYCAYVDTSVAIKLGLCLLAFCVNVNDDSLVESETGDELAYCVSLPCNSSKIWRALVLSLYSIGFLGVLNLASAFCENIADRIQTQMQQG